MQLGVNRSLVLIYVAQLLKVLGVIRITMESFTPPSTSNQLPVLSIQIFYSPEVGIGLCPQALPVPTSGELHLYRKKLSGSPRLVYLLPKALGDFRKVGWKVCLVVTAKMSAGIHF